MSSRTPIDPQAAGKSASIPASSAPDRNRRRFLLSLGAGGAGAAAAAVTQSPVGAVVPASTSPDAARSGYQETKHVRDYYRTAKV